MKDGTKTYFFDTYALIELYKGDPDYLKYTKSKVITTLLNIMELYNYLLKEINKDIAETKFNLYLKSCVTITPEIIKEAVEFRINFIDNTKFKISYVDAIGYTIARKLDIKFLTGDQAFKDLKGVEYVK